MDNSQLIYAVDQTINELYEQQGLKGLSGPDGFHTVNGMSANHLYMESVLEGRKRFGSKFNFDHNRDELLFCSDEVRYFLAMMYLYKPHINNPLKDAFDMDGYMVHPNFQNLASKRYSMYSSVVAEKIYNYWDRIGDLIAAYFPGQIAERSIGFLTAIGIIPSELRQTQSYINLENFKQSEFTDLNNIRRDTVHYIAEDTKNKHQNIKHVYNREAMEDELIRRLNLTELYKSHLLRIIDGFSWTMELITAIDKYHEANDSRGLSK